MADCEYEMRFIYGDEKNDDHFQNNELDRNAKLARQKIHDS